MIRTAVTGCSHWHLDLYLEPLLRSKGAEVVAVSDPDAACADAVATRVGCAAFTDHRELCARARPDLVVALGRHCDMAGVARFLLEEGVPFAMEKPCGLDAAEVGALARLAAGRGSFAAVPFVWRQSELMDVLREVLAGDRLTNLALRWIAGPPDRYLRAGCAWMLDPALSGGGCTINLSVHLVDLLRFLTGEGVELTSAAMSNDAHGFPVEDHSVLTLRSGSATCLAETGYLYPGPTSVFDLRFSFRADEHYVIALGPEQVEVSQRDGSREVRHALTTNVPHYPVFVDDLLRRLQADQPPAAGLDDMTAVMEVVDRAYAIARPPA
jgi:predicted dehydrogenase